jgi:hypothetical protein
MKIKDRPFVSAQGDGIELKMNLILINFVIIAV